MPTLWRPDDRPRTDRAIPTTPLPSREPTAEELAAPLNGEWRYPAEWMHNPAFRRWVWQRERD